MNARTTALAFATGAALLAATPVFAQPPGRAPAYGWRANHYHPHHYRAPAYVVYPARPVYFAPPPQVVYVPAPRPVVYVPPPRPVIYGQIPVSPGFRVGFRIGL